MTSERIAAFTLALAVLALHAAPPASAQATVQVSLSTQGVGAGADSFGVVSGNGRFVAFETPATNLVVGDTNGVPDVFVHDRWTHTTTRESLRSDGGQANGASLNASISGDGRFVAFHSGANDIVPGDLNIAADVFLRDRDAETTVLVSVDSSGGFANGSSTQPWLTPDGRYVAFRSAADDLDPGDTDHFVDVFVRDMLLGTTTRASLAVGDVEPHRDVVSFAISDDGRFVAFQLDGKSLAPGYTVNQYEIFLRDLVDGTTTVVSQTPAGAQPDGESTLPLRNLFSADARWLVYNSSATDIDPADGTIYSDLFRYDRTTGASTLIDTLPGGEQGNHGANALGISADGRYVALWSQSDNLVPNDGNGKFDVFVRDLWVGDYRRANVSSTGAESAQYADGGSMSADGTAVAFGSYGNDLVSGSGASWHHTYVHDLAAPSVQYYCTAKTNSLGCTPVVSSTGTSSLSGPDTLCITATNMISRKSGLFVWSLAAAALPFHDGVLCEMPPLERTGVQPGGGHYGPADCSGSYAFHFSHAYAASAGLAAGDSIYGQYWARDNGFAAPDNFGLTGGIQVALLP